MVSDQERNCAPESGAIGAKTLPWIRSLAAMCSRSPSFWIGKMDSGTD